MAYDKRLTKSERNTIKTARRVVKNIGDNTTMKHVVATKQRRISVEGTIRATDVAYAR